MFREHIHYTTTGPKQLTEPPIATDQIQLCVTKPPKQHTRWLLAIPNSHNLYSTITERLQKYTDLKEQLIRIWQMNTAYIPLLMLSTAGIVPNKLDESLKLLILRHSLYFIYILYILYFLTAN